MELVGSLLGACWKFAGNLLKGYWKSADFFRGNLLGVCWEVAGESAGRLLRVVVGSVLGDRWDLLRVC